MTIEVSRPSLELEDLPSFKSFQSDRAIEEEQDQLEQYNFIENIREEEEPHHDNPYEDMDKRIVEEVPYERQDSYEQQNEK